MSEEQIEEVLQALESAANFMRGMQFDPSLGSEQKSALARKVNEIDRITEKYV